MATIRVEAGDFDLAAEVAALTAGRDDVGAVASFVGLCRAEEGRLAALEIERYPGMAEAEIARVAAEAEARWPLLGCTAIHRFGTIRPGENIVLVVCAAGHRGPAFAAAEFLMDYLKTRAPFWKKAHGAEGGWIAAQEADETAAERWAPQSPSSFETSFAGANDPQDEGR